MSPDRWESVKRLFHDALARAPDARARFVAEAAGGDAELRDEVLALLAAHGRADEVSGDVVQKSAGAVAALPPGTRLGPYEIERLLGAGGMGEVYKARDSRLNRLVAVKVLPDAAAMDPERRERFGTTWDDKPRWSPDGKRIYFTSNRDGFHCIWAQDLNPVTKRPVSSPFAVYHSHSARLSIMNTGLDPVEISVSSDKLVFPMGEITGNIWMATFQGPK